MKSETALLWWWLGVLRIRRYRKLMERFGNLDTALEKLSPAVLRELGVADAKIRDVFVRIEEFDAAAYMADMDRRGVELLFYEDDDYPAPLREIGDPPLFLSFIGDISILSRPMMGVVGTRRMTHYGRRVVSHFVPGFVRSGIVTVSGLALGVDAAVAKDTLDAGGRTVAVLGQGLSTIYPQANALLADKIVKSGGLLMSEFPLDYPPTVYSFPARNRIIAGLSIGTLVVEAPLNSGSIITAELALEYNREVFAVPGQVFDDNAAGCNALIAAGQAHLVCSPDEVLREIGMVPPEASDSFFQPREGDERTVYDALDGMPRTMDDLKALIALDASRIGTALTLLELAGAVRNIGAGQWVRA